MRSHHPPTLIASILLGILHCAALAEPAKPPTADAEKWTAPAPLSPDASRRSIVVPEGFTVELVAAEPLVMSPVAFASGADMRLWVVEMADYNWLPVNDKSDKKPKGRVVYLTDTDNDGKYDTRTVFLDNLDYPTGVLPWRKGILVTAAPDIIYAEDTTPDDANKKADKIDKLYTGFVEGNPQLRVNGLQWGLDNWIYCANGLSNGVVKSHKTGQTVDIRGRDIRIRPDTGEIEPASGPSQYGRVRDDFGNWFGVDNSRLIIHYVLEDHYLRRNPHVAAPEPFIDLVLPRNPPCYPIGKKVERLHAPYMANRFTSACGIAIYRDTYLGEDMYGQVFVCEPVHNLITRRKLTEDGVTYKAERLPAEEQKEFLASTDEWFRPVHLRTGPDGALYICDMYRAVVEHPQWLPAEFNKKVDWMQGADKGRIYRVVKTATKPSAMSKLDGASTADLVKAMASLNGCRRDMAQTLLTWKNDPQSRQLIHDQLLGSTPHKPPIQISAFWLLHTLKSLETYELSSYITMAPRMPAALFPLYSANAAARESIRSAWAETVVRENAQVIKAVVCVLGDDTSEESGALLAHIALDSFFARGHPLFYAAVLSSARPHAGKLASICRDRDIPDVFVDGVAATAIGESTPKVLTGLFKAAIAQAQGNEWQRNYRLIAAILDALERKRSSISALHSSTSDEDLRLLIEQLRPVFRAARESVEKVQDDRFQAAGLIGRGWDDPKSAVKLLLDQLSRSDSPEWHLAVLGALQRLESHWALNDLPDGVWKAASPKVRAVAVSMLLRRDQSTLELLDAINGGKVALIVISPAQRQELLQHKSAAIRDRAAKVLGAITSNRAAVLESHRDVLTTTGDLTRGKEHFTKTCAVCHKIAGEGKGFGPDLGALSDHSPSALLTAILDPNQAVDPRYLNYVADTKDGDTFTGILTSETATGVTLVGADGVKRTILRKDLASLRSTSLSIMPEGLEQGLGKQGLADVIAFIASRSQPARVMAGVKATLIKPNPGGGGDGSLVLPATACEAFGKAIAYEKEDNNLGDWSNADDFAAWTISPAKAGKYEVWLDYACDTTWAGNSAVITAEPETGEATTLTAKIAPTGTFNDYQQVNIGTLELTAGTQRLIIRPGSAITGRLMDLRGVRLTPVK